MTSLKEWFQSADKGGSSIYLLDGGVSTHLRDLHGKDFAHNELWSSSLLLDKEGCDTIVQGHKDWLTAGSNILTTVTYQCHSMSKAIINDEQMEDMLQKGVHLARQAIQEGSQTKERRTQLVVASIGCYGAALADGSEYTGNYPAIKSEQDLVDFHRKKTQILLKEKPDGVALETVPCVQECRAFVSLIKEQIVDGAHPLPACWISLACRNGQELNDGSRVEEALKAIDKMDPQAELIQAIGINCCDSEHIPSLVKIITSHLAQHVRRGIAIYPNSGEEWDAKTKTWKEGTGLRRDDLQDVFAARLMEAVAIVETVWRERSDDPSPPIVLGGCCRTRPETIRALRAQIERREHPKETAAPMTAEQQQKLAAILGRDADFDRQLGEIGESLKNLGQAQQKQVEAVERQAASLQRVKDKATNL